MTLFSGQVFRRMADTSDYVSVGACTVDVSARALSGEELAATVYVAVRDAVSQALCPHRKRVVAWPKVWADAVLQDTDARLWLDCTLALTCQHHFHVAPSATHRLSQLRASTHVALRSALEYLDGAASDVEP